MENNFDVSKNDEGRYEVHLNITGNYMFEADSKTVADSIVKALEKQIVKKVILHTDKVTRKYACPNCGRLFWDKAHIANCCDKCGQRLTT